MTVEEALAIVKRFLDRGRLNKIQETIFRQSWEGQSYLEIADNCGYDFGYVKDAGSKLWQILSEAFGEKVTKNNFQLVLKQRWCQSAAEVQLLPGAGSNSMAAVGVSGNHRTDWGEAIDVAMFCGRRKEIALLEQWIVQERCRLVVLLGMGGIGKTALAVKLAQQIQEQFEYVIWRSLRNAPLILDLTAEVLQFLEKQQETVLPSTVERRVLRLLEFFRAHRCLVLLDNAESILLGSQRCGSYREGYQGYGQLLRAVAETCHQSVVVLTSREQPRGLAAKLGATLPVRSLQLTGLPSKAATKILQSRGDFQGSESEWRVLIEHYAGNPLALQMVAPAIRDFFDSSIAKFLEQGNFVFDDIRDLLERQFHRLDDDEKQVMYYLAVNREPVSFPELQAAFVVKQLSPSSLLEALASLQRRALIEKKPAGFTQQPVVMEYVTEKLIKDRNLVSSSENENIKLWDVNMGKFLQR